MREDKRILRVSWTIDQEWSEPYLDRIEFHLSWEHNDLIWCSKERRLSNITPRFLTLSSICLTVSALPYRKKHRQSSYSKTSQSVCWNLMLKKECIEFYLNSFSNNFTISFFHSFWACLCIYYTMLIEKKKNQPWLSMLTLLLYKGCSCPLGLVNPVRYVCVTFPLQKYRVGRHLTNLSFCSLITKLRDSISKIIKLRWIG